MKRVLERIAIWTASIIAMLAALAFALVATGMWALEPWLRPLVLLRVDERWLLAAAIAGWAIAAIAWPGKWRGRWWWWRAGIGTVLCVGFLFAASIPARELAMRMLMRNWDIHNAFHGDPPQWEDRDAWTKHFNERWFYMGMELPEWKQIGENSIGASSRSTQYRPRFTPFDHLLETSRWPLRKFFIMQVMRDPNAVVLSTRDWHRLFPAIVGQDVTMARRNELIGLLHEISNDASAAPATRDAATFWMGLTILTDAPEFERWHSMVRDAMLAIGDPPMSLTGDVWMRVLDALLAFDTDPTSSVEHLTNSRVLLRRAVRERVRGMEAHIPAIIREIEKFDEAGQPAAAMALWIDLKQMMDRVPDRQDHQNVRSWMRERILKWLLDDTNAFKTRFLTGYRFWANEMHDLLIDFEADDLGVLAAHAYELVISTDPGAGAKDYIKHRPYRLPTSIIQALFISNFVDDERRVLTRAENR